MGKSKLVYEVKTNEKAFNYNATIKEALDDANLQLIQFKENTESLKSLKPECDKLDYALAACSGALCGIIDIFLVSKPKESVMGHLTDKWYENKTMQFARLCGWKDGKDKSVSSAIKFLEEKFKVPYDQTGIGDAGASVFDLNPRNHHFKSLGHNPTLLGLFVSILNQFQDTSSFITQGNLISLQKANNGFELQGRGFTEKLFCGFANWFGHLISDRSGSSGSTGRGMGIPSVFCAWTNDVIAIKRTLHIEPSLFDKQFNEMALQMYMEGYDTRFQTAQIIPVVINEMIVRLFYLTRRALKYMKENPEQNLKNVLKECKPFSNTAIKRMLTVAHGAFCAIDLGDAMIRSSKDGAFAPVEFLMRLNIAGVGAFTISLYGDIKNNIVIKNKEKEILFENRESKLIEEYIEGLKILDKKYDDSHLVDFTGDLKDGLYKIALEKTVTLARKRNVDEKDIIKNKEDIDTYFNEGKKNNVRKS